MEPDEPSMAELQAALAERGRVIAEQQRRLVWPAASGEDVADVDGDDAVGVGRPRLPVWAAGPGGRGVGWWSVCRDFGDTTTATAAYMARPLTRARVEAPWLALVPADEQLHLFAEGPDLLVQGWTAGGA